MFCPNGQPHNFQAGTDLAKALEFAKVADVSGMRFILISDGEPDDRSAAMRIASTYRNRIDIIYVGSETSSRGRDFMSELARLSGGIAVTSDSVKGLSQKTQMLLAA
jgi:Mg-chelatase subunit ChlD